MKMSRDEYTMIQEDMMRLREEVMSRVKVVRRIRAFFASPAASASFAVVFLLCASIFVSFNDIVSNIMLHAGWENRVSYTYSSLVHARIAVQVLAALTSVSLLILLTKILFKLRTPAYFIGNFLGSLFSLRFFRS